MKNLISLINLLFVFTISLSAYSDDGVYQFKAEDFYFSHNDTTDINLILKEKSWFQYKNYRDDLIMKDSAFWLKMYGERLFSHRVFFLLKNPFIDMAEIYVEQNGIIVDYFEFGDHAYAPRYSGQYLQTLSIDPLSTVTFYVRIKSTGIIYFPFEMSDEFSFFEYSFTHNVFLGLFLGAFCFFLIYSMIIVIITRHSLYLQYSLFVLLMVTFYFYQEGFFIPLIGENHDFYDYLQSILVSLILFFFSLFNISYTKMKKRNKYVYYIMAFPIFLSILTLISNFFLSVNLSVILSVINFQLVTLSLFVASLYLIFTDNRHEGFFVLASTFFLSAGSYLFLFALTGIIEVNFLPKYFLQVGHSIELLLWSVALGIRVYSMKDVIKDQEYNLHYNSLTKVLNRKGVYHKTQGLICDRHIKFLTISIIDIDYFKKINDNFGHNIGDEALKYFSDFLKSSIRCGDILGRWGGEEFILILPNTNIEDTKNILDKILIKLSNSPYENIGGDTIPLAFSAGVSSYCFDKGNREFDLSSIIDSADKKLYEAKHAGRNQVFI